MQQQISSAISGSGSAHWRSGAGFANSSPAGGGGGGETILEGDAEGESPAGSPKQAARAQPGVGRVEEAVPPQPPAQRPP